MKLKDKPLGDKIMCLKHKNSYSFKCGDWVFREMDVEVFVKKEDELIKLLIGKVITPKEFWKKRQKLLGDKFTLLTENLEGEK